MHACVEALYGGEGEVEGTSCGRGEGGLGRDRGRKVAEGGGLLWKGRAGAVGAGMGAMQRRAACGTYVQGLGAVLGGRR